MNYFSCTRNKLNVNNANKKYKISLTGGVKKNGGILLLFLNMGAAPSSDHLLDRAKTLNLMLLLLMEILPNAMDKNLLLLQNPLSRLLSLRARHQLGKEINPGRITDVSISLKHDKDVGDRN